MLRPPPAAAEKPAPAAIWSIQYLRALAALMVVVHHARNPHSWLFDPMTGVDIGSAGVSLFFVISGFIMYRTVQRERPATFLARRFGRIVPMYWLVTLAMLALKQAAGMEAFSGALLKDVGQSLLFIPHVSSSEPGMVWPYLPIGWTLNLEVFFYLLLAGGALLGRPIAWTGATIVLLLVAGWASARPDPLWATYTSPIMADFLIGLAIAWLHRHADLDPGRWLLPVGLIGLAGTSGLPTDDLVRGLFSGLAVLGAVGWDDARRVPRVAALKLLGDASYAIYLLQMFGIGAAGWLVRHSPAAGVAQFAAMILLSILLASGLGIVAHRLIERPLLRALPPRRNSPARPVAA